MLYNKTERSGTYETYPKVKERKIKATIYKVLPITETETAHDILYRGKNVGKVILEVKLNLKESRFIMNFKDVPKKYRPIPFWSWNEKLETEETRRQVNIMNDNGYGGYFMHARGGLQTEYLGEEWFDNVTAAVEEGEKNGMRPFAYDENGWPSGFGGGAVNGLGVEYQQKYLRIEESKTHHDTFIAQNGEHYFYYDINPFYVDTLDKKVVAAFIDCTYKPYYEKYGTRIEGFFTDEPQISRNGIPWSFVFENEYKERYGEDIKEYLEELFLPVKDYKQTRIKFWKMVTDLFSSAFVKQIHDWCEEKGLKLTGHLVLEETMGSQLASNGACMPHYEYFHIPGMDWLGRRVFDVLTMHQVGSVAQQLGKKQVLSETFALCGHNVSLAELKGIYEWQMVRGVNLLCQHLEGYSLRGIRKRDYPPAMYYQQPWWDEYGKWVDAMSRVSMILTEGKAKADVLLLHPQTTAWTMFDNTNFDEIRTFDKRFLAGIRELENKHIGFHLGDETIMERHARVENGKLIIGEQAYSYVIDCFCKFLLDNTQNLLKEFKAQGGKVVSIDEIAENKVINNQSISYTARYYDDFTVHYFVNTSPEEKTAEVYAEGKKLDIYTGDMESFNGVHTFEPWGSLMIIEDGSPNTKHIEKEYTDIYLEGEFKTADNTLNTMTLDHCDYYFDGVLQEENGYVLNIAERANKLERKVQIHQDYKVQINTIPSVLYLVTESPDQFKITVNGQEIDKKVLGYFRDKSFKKLDIAKYVKTGENIISFDCDFVQSQRFYEDLKKSFVFESEKNKLAYDMEIEAVYLLGNFGVETNGEWTELGNNACRYKGGFAIDKLPESVSLKNLEQNGFPFFCGELELEGEINITDENTILKLDIFGVNAIKVEIGDFKATALTDNKLCLEGISIDRHKIKLTLINNLRNLLGPHHLEIGESWGVHPGSFFKENCVWNTKADKEWNDDYCFVKFGRKLTTNS